MLNRIPKGFETLRQSAEKYGKCHHAEQLTRTTLDIEDKEAIGYVAGGYSYALYNAVPLVTCEPSREGWLTEVEYGRLTERYNERLDMWRSIFMELMQLLYDGVLQGYLLLDDGQVIQVPNQCWAGLGVKPDLKTSLVSFNIDRVQIFGTALIKISEIDDYLNGVDDAPKHFIKQNRADLQDESGQRIKPAQMRALRLIKSAFGDHIPVPYSMAVVKFVDLVLDHHDKRSGTAPSKDSILRAAGWRRDQE